MNEKTRAAGGFTLTITVETALYVVAVLVALAARLGDLGGRPMQESEAVAALAAWRAHQGLPLNLAGASSVVVLFDVIFFILFGAGNAAARLAPALFGTVLVAMPYFLRDFLGRSGAIFACFVFALSPSFAYFSRFSSGSIIAVFAGLGAALAWQRYRETGGARYVYIGALALALLVTSYPGAYTFLAAFALYAAYATRSGWLDLDDLARRLEMRRAGLMFALAAIVIATGFLYYPPGVQTGLVDLLAAWAQGLWPLGGSLPWYYHLELLVIYEPLVALLGLLSLGWLGAKWLDRWRARQRESLRQSSGSWEMLLSLWMLVALAALLLGRRKDPGDVLLLLVPLSLLSACFVNRLLTALLEDSGKARDISYLFLLLSADLVAVVAKANQAPFLGGRFVSLERLLRNVELVCLFLPVFAVMLAATGWYVWRLQARGTAIALGLAVVVFLSAFGMRTSWLLNTQRSASPGEPLVLAPTLADASVMVRELKEQASALGEADAPLLADSRLGPVVAWYLRDYRHVRWARVPVEPSAALVLVPFQGSPGQAPRDWPRFALQGYNLSAGWSPEISPGEDWLNWLLHRVGEKPIEAKQVVLYVNLGQ